MTGPHPIAAAIDGLVALWTGPPELAYDDDGEQVQLRVVDGMSLEDIEDRRALFVGIDAQYAEGGAQTNTRFDLAGRADQIDIACEVLIWSGDTDLAAARSTAFSVLDVLSALLRQDPHLGGVVDWARVTRTGYRPAQEKAGAAALIPFTVRVDAHRDHEG